MRRDVPSVNAAYDNSTAILVGDLLFGKASQIVAGLGSAAVLIQARPSCACAPARSRMPGPRPGRPRRVLPGRAGRQDRRADRHRADTARCSVGPPGAARIVKGVRGTSGDRLPAGRRHHRHRVGPCRRGKTPGTDLREGVPTLPVLYALADGRARRRAPGGAAVQRQADRPRAARRGARAAAGASGDGAGPGRPAGTGPAVAREYITALPDVPGAQPRSRACATSDPRAWPFTWPLAWWWGGF